MQAKNINPFESIVKQILFGKFSEQLLQGNAFSTNSWFFHFILFTCFLIKYNFSWPMTVQEILFILQ